MRVFSEETPGSGVIEIRCWSKLILSLSMRVIRRSVTKINEQLSRQIAESTLYHYHPTFQYVYAPFISHNLCTLTVSAHSLSIIESESIQKQPNLGPDFSNLRRAQPSLDLFTNYTDQLTGFSETIEYQMLCVRRNRTSRNFADPYQLGSKFVTQNRH